jgi:predicted TIM-barrel fold metal-dependent hydrolase
MLSLPLSEPEAAIRQIETFADRKHVTGFLITSVRPQPVHHNRYMKVYRALEERGLPLCFHSAINPQEPVFKSLNRFASVHGLGFPFYNIVHMTNWVTNGIGVRFPKLPVIWIEGGLAWIPFLMQRLDHEFMLRPSEYPLLKKRPSDYMRDMYYASSRWLRVRRMHFHDRREPLLYASDYPHWDFGLPSSIHDLPFLAGRWHILRHCGACSAAAATTNKKIFDGSRSGGLSRVPGAGNACAVDRSLPTAAAGVGVIVSAAHA